MITQCPVGLKGRHLGLIKGHRPAGEGWLPFDLSQPQEVKVLLEEVVAEATETRRLLQETQSDQRKARREAKGVLPAGLRQRVETESSS